MSFSIVFLSMKSLHLQFVWVKYFQVCDHFFHLTEINKAVYTDVSERREAHCHTHYHVCGFCQQLKRSESSALCTLTSPSPGTAQLEVVLEVVPVGSPAHSSGGADTCSISLRCRFSFLLGKARPGLPFQSMRFNRQYPPPSSCQQAPKLAAGESLSTAESKAPAFSFLQTCCRGWSPQSASMPGVQVTQGHGGSRVAPEATYHWCLW